MTTATLRRAPISHRKLSLACDMVRNMTCAHAIAILSIQIQKSCQILYQLLVSAVSNAENNHNINPDSLIIHTIDVGPATRLRRIHPRGRGRAAPVRKHYSNITVTLKTKVN